METTLIQVQATFIKSLVPKFLNIKAKQCCSGQYSNRIACTIFPNKRYITSSIAECLHCALQWATFSFLQYGTWEGLPTETRYTLKCRHVPFCWETTSPIVYAQAILTTLLGMTHVSEKFMPWLQTAEQKEHCFTAVWELWFAAMCRNR